MTAEHRRERDARHHDAAAIRDVWQVLAWARTDDAPRALAAAQGEVFRRYQPMARTLANRQDAGGRPVDPANAERAAELGLAQAVLGWRRPDGDGFELFAGIAIATQLDRLPVANTGDGLGHSQPGRWPPVTNRHRAGARDSRFSARSPGAPIHRARGGYPFKGRYR
ncbi:MAG TPA: hypothetical protein VES60_12190 [Nakamurella sp.]|nr:hypothetical protein [Nakamurella sp.]